eukprot:jgi/Picsp_1/2561/NSC_00792-R1_transcription factor dp-1
MNEDRMIGTGKKQKVAEDRSPKRNREGKAGAEGHREEGNALDLADDTRARIAGGQVDAHRYSDGYQVEPPAAVAPAALILAHNHDPTRISRTLKELSENFLAEFCSKDEDTIIDVDVAAQVICASKRRIYDVVNVLSGLGLVVKSHKGRYIWKGYSSASESIEHIMERHSKPEQQEAEKKSWSDESNNRTIQMMPCLTEKFVFKLISSPDKRIELEKAALELMGPIEDHKKSSKARIRRLYDIANVLQTLGIIEKSKCEDARSAVFVWKGIDKLPEALKDAKKFNPEAAARHVIRPKRAPPLENPSVPYMQGFFPFMPSGYESAPMMQGQGYSDGLGGFQSFPMFGPDMLQPFAFSSPIGERQTDQGEEKTNEGSHSQRNHTQQGVGNPMENHLVKNMGDSISHHQPNWASAPPGFMLWPAVSSYDPYMKMTPPPSSLPNAVPQQQQGQFGSPPIPLNGIASEFVQSIGQQDTSALNYDLQMQYMNMYNNLFRNTQTSGIPPGDAGE